MQDNSTSSSHTRQLLLTFCNGHSLAALPCHIELAQNWLIRAVPMHLSQQYKVTLPVIYMHSTPCQLLLTFCL